MAPRVSLIVAVLAFLAGLGVLAADTALGVDAHLEWRDAGGTWRTVSSDGEFRHEPVAARAIEVPANGTVEFRLTVQNDRPLALSGPVVVTWQAYGPGGASTVDGVDEHADVPAFGSRRFTFTLTEDELVPDDGLTREGEPAKPPTDSSGNFFVETPTRSFSFWASVRVVGEGSK